MKIKNKAFQKAFGRFVKDKGMNPNDLTEIDLQLFVKETFPGIKKVAHTKNKTLLTT